jgi:hypothetical protein
MPITYPVAPFNAAQTVFGAKVIAVFTPRIGVGAIATTTGTTTVTGFTIVNGGTGYTTPPTVVLTGGGFTTASTGWTAVLTNGVVTGITGGTAGSGYVSAPTVSFVSNGTPFNIAGKVGDLVYKTGAIERMVPGADLVMRPDRQATKEAKEDFTIVDIEEIEALLTNLVSFSPAARTGTCVLWIIDQNDPTATSVRLKSNLFLCALSPKDGTTKFGGGDFSKYSIEITSLDPAGIVWTPNATS